MAHWLKSLRVRYGLGGTYPSTSLMVVLVVSLLFSAFDFGADVALDAIISLFNATLLVCYVHRSYSVEAFP